MTTTLTARSGAALAAVIVVLLVIDCVVLGTLQLALLETRIGENGLLLLRLRTAARAAAHDTAARWDAGLDSLPVAGITVRSAAPADTTLTAHVTVERAAPALYVVRARAQLAASPHAATSAALLVVPPLLDARFDPAGAALTADFLEISGDGSITAVPDGCSAATVLAVGLAGGGNAVPAGDAVIGGIEPVNAEASLAATFARAAAVARHAAATDALVTHPGPETRLDDELTGVHVVGGNAVVAASLEGLLLVGGDVEIEPGGVVRGAVHALGTARVAGSVVLDACVVRAGLERGGLLRPRLLSSRPVIPSF